MSLGEVVLSEGVDRQLSARRRELRTRQLADLAGGLVVAQMVEVDLSLTPRPSTESAADPVVTAPTAQAVVDMLTKPDDLGTVIKAMAIVAEGQVSPGLAAALEPRQEGAE
jgi:hypothetical protein